jgi:hypothetical protein
LAFSLTRRREAGARSLKNSFWQAVDTLPLIRTQLRDAWLTDMRIHPAHTIHRRTIAFPLVDRRNRCALMRLSSMPRSSGGAFSACSLARAIVDPRRPRSTT